MGKQEKRVLTLDRYEHGVVVNALNEILEIQRRSIGFLHPAYS